MSKLGCNGCATVLSTEIEFALAALGSAIRLVCSAGCRRAYVTYHRAMASPVSWLRVFIAGTLAAIVVEAGTTHPRP